jgi:alanine racemase
VTERSSSGLLRWATVDVAALRDNAAVVRHRLAPDTNLLAMVKSNGYGHGAETAARAALEGGATWLGVYTPDEAMSLRAADFEEPILVVGWSPPSTLVELIEHNVDVTVVDADGVGAAAAAAGATRRRARIHVKVDSGLGRLGVRSELWADLMSAVRKVQDRLEIAGIFTHFADAEADDEFTREQHRRFLEAVEQLRPVAPEALLHTCGSAAILYYPEMHHDLVRLGIALYGYAPRDQPVDVAVRCAMSVFARVAQVKTVDTGDSVGYGQGLPRALSNRGQVALGGRRCRIAGIVNMDQVTVDITEAGPVASGDVAMFFGERAGMRLGADEVADQVGTIPHEILCGIPASVPRLAADPA